MTPMELMKSRHSVRKYLKKPIDPKTLACLQAKVIELNHQSGLQMQLVTNEPKAFQGILAKYGGFQNVQNYLAIIGKDDEIFDLKAGWFGQEFVLYAQELGLNSCWVGATFKKVHTVLHIGQGEKLGLVIAFGYGATQGTPHKSKSITQVSNATSSSPAWFMAGVKAALLAPTALNQQKFYFELKPDDKVVPTTKKGPFTQLDLGIAMYQFELAAGKDNFTWA
ncbi:MAG: nitroreductase family protein [Allobaculum sp.]|nr:nitroreductase family protein [Allobaculum sp.]